MKLMNKLFLLSTVCLNLFCFCQVGINTATPESSSELDVNSNPATNNKGVLIPRISLTGATDITTIPSPANGLLVFNINNSDNGTPSDLSDDVKKDQFYFFNLGRWSRLIDDRNLNQAVYNLLLNRLVALINMKQFGNDLTFVSNDYGNNIRKFIFDNKIADKLNTFNASNGEFTAPFTGYYLINMNILLKPWSNNFFEPSNKKPLRLGLAKPYNNAFITSGATDTIFYNSTEILDSAQGANYITYMSYKNIIYLEAGQKTVPLVKYITPGTNTNEYNLNTELNNYDRTITNTISIIFLPIVQ